MQIQSQSQVLERGAKMIYQEKFKIGLKDVGKNNEITNKGILEALENIAAYHSDSVGYGINTTKETHLTWILLDWKVKVIKRPKYGQVMDIKTWSRYIIKCYAYRDFEIYDEKGNLCVIATSKWLLINTNRGRIAKVEDEIAKKYDSESKSVFGEEKLEKINVPETFENSISYQTRRKDIDIIGHMHNLYYLDLAYETLTQEVYEKRPFDNIRIMYKKEIKLGDKVLCKYAKVANKNVVVIEGQDTNVLHAVIELA